MEQLNSEEVKKLRQRYPDKVPVFAIKAQSAHDIPTIKNRKFLVPSNITVGGFMFILRKQLVLPPERALFIFVNNILPTSSTLMSELYATHKSSDGALHVVYTSENTFGCDMFLVDL